MQAFRGSAAYVTLLKSQCIFNPKNYFASLAN